jgi:hypothetical protein
MVKIGLFRFPLKLFGGVFKTYGNGGWCHDLAFFCSRSPHLFIKALNDLVTLGLIGWMPKLWHAS